MPNANCPRCNARFPASSCCTQGRTRPGLFATLFQLLLLYVGLLFTGGTLINTGHPVAVETGRLIHTVTFVEPAITWAKSSGYTPLAFGLRTVAEGIRFS